MLNNKNILNNLRDGLPYPYTKKNAEDMIHREDDMIFSKSSNSNKLTATQNNVFFRPSL